MDMGTRTTWRRWIGAVGRVHRSGPLLRRGEMAERRIERAVRERNARDDRPQRPSAIRYRMNVGERIDARLYTLIDPNAMERLRVCEHRPECGEAVDELAPAEVSDDALRHN